MGNFLLSAMLALGAPQSAPSAAPTAGEAPLTVAFSPNNPNGSFYQWQFHYNPAAGFSPDYSSGIGEDVLFTYTAPGTYTARLRIHDAITGAPADTDFTITVSPPPEAPTVAFTTAPPLSVPGTVTFAAEAAAAPGRRIASYTWDFNGDGAPDATSPGGPSASMDWSFTRQGPCTVSVTAADDGGLGAIASTAINISSLPAVSFPTPRTRLAATGSPITMTASASTDAPWAIASYTWDFGDGTGSTGPSATASHTYAAAGDYAVKVTVANTAGQSGHASLAVQARTPPAILLVQDSATPGAKAPNGTIPVTATLTVMALPPPGDPVTSYGWDFNGDGINDQTSPGGASATVTHTWPDHTSAAVTARAYLRFRQPLSAGISITIPISKPGNTTPTPAIALAASADGAPAAPPIRIRAGHVVTFTATAEGSSPGDILTAIYWDFDGDGLRDQEDDLSGLNAGTARISASFQYRDAGTFTAQAKVYQEGGGLATAAMTVEVSPGAAPLECFISQPRHGQRVWGNHVTLQARAAPAALARHVEFRFRPDGSAAPWRTIGTAWPPPYTALSVPWNVTRLAPGPYEILALATDASNNVASSDALQKVVVIVDPVNPDEEENLDAVLVRTHTIDPNVSTRTEIAGDTAIEFPPHAFGMEYTTIRLERPFSNPHPLEARMQQLQFVPGSFRRLALDGGTALLRPSRIGLYDLNPGGVLDELNVDVTKLKIYQFDDAERKWVPLPGQITQPAEDLARATLTSMGDVGLVVTEPVKRAPSGSSSGGCGLLGPELLALALLFARRRRVL